MQMSHLLCIRDGKQAFLEKSRPLSNLLMTGKLRTGLELSMKAA